MKKYFALGTLLVLTTFGCSQEKVIPALSQEVYKQPLEVSGSFPDWLAGTFVRNSAIPVLKNGTIITHEFDGLAMLHNFCFQDGKVAYTNRFLKTAAHHKVLEEQSSEFHGFAQQATAPVNEEGFVKNASVNVFQYAGSFVALTEVPPPACFDLQSLETLGNFTFDDDLPNERCWESAHPHKDVSKNELVNYLIEFGRQSNYLFYKMQKGSNKRELVAKVPVTTPSYMHSFSMTEHYLIVTAYPLVVEPRKLAEKAKPFIENFEWKPDLGTKIIVIDRSNGQVVTEKKTPALFSFHHANAYEEGDGSIVLDLIAYPDLSDLSQLLPKGNWERGLLRYQFSLHSDTVTASYLKLGKLEFPRLNDAFDGKRYRYLYMTEGNGVVKFDHETENSISWSDPDFVATEPVFIAKEHAEDEDDGVLLFVANSKSKAPAKLICLDAKSFEKLACATLPWNIPSTFHGQYFDHRTL